MSEAIAAILADHGARITNNEKEITGVGSKLDRLYLFALVTMASSIGGLVAFLFSALKK